MSAPPPTPGELLRRLEQLYPHSLLDQLMDRLNFRHWDRPSLYHTHGTRCLSFIEWVDSEPGRSTELLAQLDSLGPAGGAEPITNVSDIPSALIQLGYVIGPQLAEGGQGVVYAATQHEVPCVVKISKDSFEESPDLLKELARLRQFLSLMPHERFVELRAIHQLQDDQGRTRLITAWHRASHNLAERMDDLKSQGVPEEQRVRRLVGYIVDAAEGLDYLHAHGIVHRDIKPGNLFFYQADQRVRLGDLGLIKMVGITGHTTLQPSIGGTYLYMAPEQLQGDAKYASDLFALAITYIHLRTGNPQWMVRYRQFRPQIPPLNSNEAALLEEALQYDVIEREKTQVLDWAQRLKTAVLRYPPPTAPPSATSRSPGAQST